MTITWFSLAIPAVEDGGAELAAGEEDGVVAAAAREGIIAAGEGDLIVAAVARDRGVGGDDPPAAVAGLAVDRVAGDQDIDRGIDPLAGVVVRRVARDDGQCSIV